jgi:hypothetical protein
MGIGFREHIASLLAVFIALAVGILIGVSLSRQEPLERRMATLTQQFEGLRRENRELRDGTARLERSLRARGEFDAPLLPSLVAGRLSDVPVALVWVGEFGQVRFEHDIGQTLAMAGAKVVGSLSLAPRLVADASADKIPGATEESPSGPESPGQTVSRVGRMVGAGLWEQLRPLAQMGLVTLSGEASGKPRAVVVVTCLQSEEASPVERLLPHLVEGLRENADYVLAAEPTTAPGSSIGVYRRSGVTTVDNVDTVPGQVAMVWALAARAEGAFGVKDTAQALVPKG